MSSEPLNGFALILLAGNRRHNTTAPIRSESIDPGGDLFSATSRHTAIRGALGKNVFLETAGYFVSTYLMTNPRRKDRLQIVRKMGANISDGMSHQIECNVSTEVAAGRVIKRLPQASEHSRLRDQIESFELPALVTVPQTIGYFRGKAPHLGALRALTWRHRMPCIAPAIKTSSRRVRPHLTGLQTTFGMHEIRDLFEFSVATVAAKDTSASGSGNHDPDLFHLHASC